VNALPDDRGRFAAVPARSVRFYTPPATLAGKLWSWRFLILRRVSQIGILLVFYGTVHWGWQGAGKPLLTGNLSASEVLGLIPMADGYAVLQQLLTGHMLQQEVLIGAGITIAFYTLLGGRLFCSWVCPVNIVTDFAGWLRNKLAIPDPVRFPRSIRYGVLALSLVLSGILGLAAFEWLSPISMLHREIIYGVGFGVAGAAGIFLFDLLVKRHGWCGHVCPLGAFYALLGKAAQVRIRFDKNTCTHCGECHRVCPEPKVLDLKDATRNGLVVAGECTNCFRCVPICPEHSLSIDLRPLIKQHNLNASQQARRQA
jgi:ferredoxin-type protein NapH